MRSVVKAKLSVVAALVAGNTVFAQVPFSGGFYSQNFDALSSIVGAPVAWTNNVTLPAWYASRTVAPTDVTNYSPGTGTSTAGSLYSFGSSGSTERALGSLASGTPGDFAYGLRCINDTGFARTNIIVSYTGEQWRVAHTNVHKLTFSYQVGVSLTNADARDLQAWTPFPALDFASPNTNATSSLNGNAATNRMIFTNVALSGVVVPAGHELFLRWFDPDDAGFDDGLAIDNLTVSFGDAITNAPQPPVTGFSLVHYNVKGNFAPDWTTNALQVQAIARQLQYLNPDIITLNEVPNGLRHEMTNWMIAFFPNYQLAISSATDGFLRSAVITRFSINRSASWLDGITLTNFGYNGAFTRDLFEVELAVPGFAQPLHVFTTHLKSGPDEDSQNRRAAECSAISNYFATAFLSTNSLRPYVLTGDLNEDIQITMSESNQPIQRLIAPSTGLRLTTPLNPFTLSRFTHSIQGTIDARFDYIVPCSLLFSNTVGSEVFRTDLLIEPPPPLLASDSVTASDHLPVLMLFDNPYDKPFRILSIARIDPSVQLTWQSVPGQPYRVESSTNLVAWTTIASNLMATGWTYAFATNAPADPSFFRIRRE